MPAVTVVFGLLLIGLGAGGYFGSESGSWTAWIPAFFGLPLLLCGVLAFQEKMLKHAMHLAAMIGLIGFLLGAGRIVSVLLRGTFTMSLAFAMQAAMAGLCAVFVGLCVNSFIQARKARAKQSHP